MSTVPPLHVAPSTLSADQAQTLAEISTPEGRKFAVVLFYTDPSGKIVNLPKGLDPETSQKVVERTQMILEASKRPLGTTKVIDNQGLHLNDGTTCELNTISLSQDLAKTFHSIKTHTPPTLQPTLSRMNTLGQASGLKLLGEQIDSGSEVTREAVQHLPREMQRHLHTELHRERPGGSIDELFNTDPKGYLFKAFEKELSFEKEEDQNLFYQLLTSLARREGLDTAEQDWAKRHLRDSFSQAIIAYTELQHLKFYREISHIHHTSHLSQEEKRQALLKQIEAVDRTVPQFKEQILYYIYERSSASPAEKLDPLFAEHRLAELLPELEIQFRLHVHGILERQFEGDNFMEYLRALSAAEEEAKRAYEVYLSSLPAYSALDLWNEVEPLLKARDEHRSRAEA